MEESYMVCMRVDELDDPVTGSTTTACVECGDDIWISQESRKEMSQVGAMPLCSRCATRFAQEHPVEMRSVGMPSQGQAQEVIQAVLAKAEAHPEWKSMLDEEVDPFDALKITASLLCEVMDGPDADWGALATVVTYEDVVMPPVPISEMLRAGIPKAVIARRLLPAMVHAGNAKRVLIGLSSWTLSGKDPDLDGPISEHPDRKEMLVLIDITADGVQQLSTAEIMRDGVSNPRLGEWHDVDKPEASDGLFVDALIPALQLVRTLHEQES